jgi:hypothetical protein
MQSEVAMTRDLQDALDGISHIRSQIAHSGDFKGYGFGTVAASGLVAWIAAGLQALLIADPIRQFPDFVLLWSVAALLAVFPVGIEMVWRARRHHAGLAPSLLRAALSQILPAGAAGALLTIVLMSGAPEVRSLIPGLWQILFSLGLFASHRFLPRGAYAAAVWYLGAGLIDLGMPLTPWTMGIAFGAGQFLLAVAFWLQGGRS